MIKHGHACSGKITRTYRTWQKMKIRCADPLHEQFRHYGGRGIKVCKRWESFVSFLEDMGERPEGKTIDRIDGNKGYYKENCKWSTVFEQHRNRRDNRWITYKGKTFCLADWIKYLGFTKNVLDYRLNSGWSTEKAFETPIKKCTRN